MAKEQSDFSYDFAPTSGGTRLGVSIYADRPYVREQMREDALKAGLSMRECAGLRSLHEHEIEQQPRPVSEVVLVDCPEFGSGDLSAIARLDDRAAKAGAQLVLSTSFRTLDITFAVCDRSDPQILVNPTRAERIVALGRAMASSAGTSVRELSEGDRMMLLRLTEQVGSIAEKLGKFGEEAGGDSEWTGQPGPGAKPGERTSHAPRPALPDPRLVRRIIQLRQARGKFFDGELFADPAWDMLLDLTAARAEHQRVAVTSLCIASGVPPTTALRWITQMTKAELLARVEDATDKRRAFIALTDRTADAMARYFAELGKEAVHIV